MFSTIMGEYVPGVALITRRSSELFDLTPLTWFFAIVGSGITNALMAYFIQRFLVKPLDRKISELTIAISSFNNNYKKIVDTKQKKVDGGKPE